MATNVALRQPEEQLSDHEWTKEWTLPTSGRGRMAEVGQHSLNVGPSEPCWVTTEKIGHEPRIVHGHIFYGTGFDFEEGGAFGC
jgi:hypothetical protein